MNGNIEYIYILIAAAILILVIACINFINLTTAQSAERAKEIGIRKTLGAFRRQLIFQFTGESVLVAFLAMMFAIALIELASPFFSVATDNATSFNFYSLSGTLLALTLLVGVIAGFYPSCSYPLCSLQRSSRVNSCKAHGAQCCGIFLRYFNSAHR